MLVDYDWSRKMEWITWSNPVTVWWFFLSSIALINVLFLFWLRIYRKSRPSQFNNQLLVLSSIYTLGCAYRSVFPKADVQRIALFDTWLSSVFLGRTVATFAELAFVAQWFLILKTYSAIQKDQITLRLSHLLLPMIVVAEICSWYAVITTNYIGNTIEESLWALCYTLIGICLFMIQKNVTGYLRLATRIAIFGCLLYVSFMAFVDVPMYFNRFMNDLQSNKEYFGLWEGIVDLNTRWIVTHTIADWREEIPWMTLYFSLAVWVSLALTFVPEPKTSTKDKE
jgi:hypothetical protein